MAKRKKTASKKPIGLGLVGLGRAGINMHCKELELKNRLKKFNLVAACDPDASRRKMVEEKYGCRTYATVEELIADDGVELVDIANRTPEHTPDALKALRAGKDVYLEKPIAVSYEEAKQLMATARRCKADLYIRHNRRFEPAFNHIREIIDSGVLGKVYEIKLRRVQYQRRDDWQTIQTCAGGQLLNWGPHIIDHGLQFLDGKVDEIWSDLKSLTCAGDAEDHLKIVMKGKDGCIVDLEISGSAAVKEPEYIIFGTKGGLICDEAANEIRLRYLDPKKKLTPRRAKKSSPELAGFGSPDELKWVEKTLKINPKCKCQMHDIWDYLYDSIRLGKTFPISLDEALQVMEVIGEVKKGTPFENNPAKKKTKRKTTRKRKKT
jgi:predicted dehydrogenase